MPNYRQVVLDVISAIGGDVTIWQSETCEREIDKAIAILVHAFGKHGPVAARINLLARLIQQNFHKWEGDSGEDELHAQILACIQKTLGIESK